MLQKLEIRASLPDGPLSSHTDFFSVQVWVLLLKRKSAVLGSIDLKLCLTLFLCDGNHDQINREVFHCFEGHGALMSSTDHSPHT